MCYTFFTIVFTHPKTMIDLPTHRLNLLVLSNESRPLIPLIERIKYLSSEKYTCIWFVMP
jgi:hypothetical protein